MGGSTSAGTGGSSVGGSNAGTNAVGGASSGAPAGGSANAGAGAGGATSGSGGSTSVAGTGSSGAAGGSGAVGGAGGASAGAAGSGAGGTFAGAAGEGGSAGASVAGSSGSGGSTPVDPTDGPLGWASVDADGVNGTTGGEGGPTVEIRTADEMVQYGEDSEPRVLRIMNDLTGAFDIGSNKTVVGANANVTITGNLGITGSADAMISNVIVQNLKLNGVASEEDAMDVRYAHHVWVDHCEFFDGPDGNLDVVYQSSYVTVSWSKFYYTPAYHPAADETETADHRFSNLIGNGNSMTADRGRLRVTFHHNWWAEGVIERMPRVRFGEVHLFNNYFSSQGNNYCIAAGVEAKIVAEHNFFENVNDPHIFYSGEATAQIVATGNHYVNTTGLQDSGQGSAFTPPYPYSLAAAESVKATVMANVGPR
jgi:pectate lyase